MHRVLLLVFLLLVPSQLFSNMANPYQKGDFSGEPVIVSDMSIRSENLKIDLSPMEKGNFPLITAEYLIHNPKPKVKTKLFFYAPGILKGKIEINGSSIPSRKDISEIPSWFRYKEKSPGLSFYAFLDKGLNRINVQYSVKPYIYNGSKVFAQYSLEYLFAPSRTWKDFSNLTLEIIKPEGWDVVTVPPIKNFKVKLNNIPSDLFKIKFEKRSILNPFLTWFIPFTAFAGLVLTAVIAFKKEKFSDLKFTRALMFSIPYLILSEVLLIALVFSAYFSKDFILGDDITFMSTAWEYGQFYFFIFTLFSSGIFCVIGFYSTIFLKIKMKK